MVDSDVLYTFNSASNNKIFRTNTIQQEDPQQYQERSQTPKFYEPPPPARQQQKKWYHFGSSFNNDTSTDNILSTVHENINKQYPMETQKNAFNSIFYAQRYPRYRIKQRPLSISSGNDIDDIGIQRTLGSTNTEKKEIAEQHHISENQSEGQESIHHEPQIGQKIVDDPDDPDPNMEIIKIKKVMENQNQQRGHVKELPKVLMKDSEHKGSCFNKFAIILILTIIIGAIVVAILATQDIFNPANEDNGNKNNV